MAHSPCVPAREESKLKDEWTDFALYKQSLDIARYVVNKKLKIARLGRHDIGDVVFEIYEKTEVTHRLFLKSVGEKLSLDRENFEATLGNLMSMLFVEGKNSGRILSLYALCISVAEFCYSNGMPDLIDRVVHLTAVHAAKQERLFDELGGWSGVVEKYSDLTKGFWTSLFVTTASLAAVAALLYAKSSRLR